MQNTNLIVYVPVPEEAPRLGIAAGSGIVAHAEKAQDDRVLVYYEGNLFGAANIRCLEDRVYHAAGRLVTRYPTIARASLPRTSLIEVGRFNYSSRRFTAISNPSALLAWAPDETALVQRFA